MVADRGWTEVGGVGNRGRRWCTGDEGSTGLFIGRERKEMSTRRNSGMSLAGEMAKLMTAACSGGQPAMWRAAAAWKACEEPAEVVLVAAGACT